MPFLLVPYTLFMRTMMTIIIYAIEYAVFNGIFEQLLIYSCFPLSKQLFVPLLIQGIHSQYQLFFWVICLFLALNSLNCVFFSYHLEVTGVQFSCQKGFVARFEPYESQLILLFPTKSCSINCHIFSRVIFE